MQSGVGRGLVMLRKQTGPRPSGPQIHSLFLTRGLAGGSSRTQADGAAASGTLPNGP